MYGAKQLSKQNILELITEYDIFNFYIRGFNSKTTQFKSELRSDDKNASCSITLYNDHLLYKDFGTGESYNCFDYVGVKYNLTFYEALSVINTDFNLNLSDRIKKKKSINKNPDYKTNIKLIAGIIPGILNDNHKLKEIKVKRRGWNTYDVAYWGSYCLNRKILERFNIAPVSHYWMNDNVFTTDFNKNLTYAYYFGNGRYKLLRPNNLKYKWLSNCSSNVIQGWKQLPKKGNLLVITKSLKDVAIFSMFNIPAIAPQAESINISENIIDNLKSRFEVIISNYDYDRAGKLGAAKLRRLYNIQPIMFDNSFKAKDLGEYIQENKFNKTKILLDETRIRYNI